MRTCILAFACLLLFLPFAAYSQEEAQAGDEPIVLARQNRTRIIAPGRRIKLYGPPGTTPIKGRLVSMGDSITIRPDRNRLHDQQQKVAVTDIQAVGQRRLGWQFMTWYYGITVLSAIAIVLFIGLYGLVFSTGVMAILIGAILLRYGSLAVVSALVARPKYSLDKWKWDRRENQ